MKTFPVVEEFRRRVMRHGFRWITGRASQPLQLPSREICRILVIRPNHRLGNSLLLTPLLGEIERAYPGAEVDIISAGAAAVDVFKRFGMVRNVICLPNKIVRHPIALWKVFHHLRRQRYDLAIDPSKASQTARLFLRAARAAHKLGFELGPRRISCGVELPKDVRHIGQLPVYLLRRARGETFDLATCPPLDIRLGAAERKAGQRCLRRVIGQSTSQAPCIGLFCDAAGAKALPKSWWSELWRHLALLWPTAIFVEIVPISGAPMLGGTLPAYYSTSIRRLSSLLSVMNLVISADSGVMHLAVASGTCTVGLFKVTDAEVYAPYGHGSFGVVVTRQSAEAIAHYIANHCNLQTRSSVAA